jgi:hypothetical protein
MKTKVFLQSISKGLFLILALLLTACIGTVLATVSGINVAVTGTQASGLTDTHDVDGLSSDLNLEDISKDIALLNPSRFPMDTLFRSGAFGGAKGRIEKSKSLIKKYYGYINQLGNDTLDTSGSTTEAEGTTSGTALKSYTYTTGNGATTKWLLVENVEYWTVGTTLIMRDLSVSPTGVVAASSLTAKTDVLFIVTDVDGNAIKLQPLNGILGLNTNAAAYVFPNFTSSTILYKGGPAKGDLDLTDTYMSMYPTPGENFCQNFIRTVSEAEFERMQAKEVEWSLTDMEKIQAYNLRAEIEFQNYWGAKAAVSIGGRTRYTMAGADKFISTTVNYGTGGSNRTISRAQFINIFKTAFVGNSGSDRKLLLGGATLIASFMDFLLSNTTYFKSTTKESYGVKFKNWETEFGDVNVIHAPIFTDKGWTDNGMLLDMEYVHKAEFIPFRRRVIDLTSNGTANANVVSLQEVSTMWLDNDACHLLIKPTA